MPSYKGVAHGRTIEVDAHLPYPDGQRVRVTVEPISESLRTGGAERIRQAMRAPPHLDSLDVDELERAIESAKLPVRTSGLFDAGA